MKISGWILGCVSALQVFWGLNNFAEYFRAVGGGRDSTDAWILTGLGISGFCTLRWRRLGYVNSVLQSVVILGTLRWIPVVLLAIRLPSNGLSLFPIGPQIGLLILPIVMMVITLCTISALTSLRVARTGWHRTLHPPVLAAALAPS